MVLFPNCKINLGLNIIRKRRDQYHDIETVFYPIQINDALEVIELNEPSEITEKQSGIIFSNSGLTIDANTENNLCVRAYQLLKKDIPQIPSVKLHLHKAIPIGAGLGGGSADAAFTLQLLNKKLHLNLSVDQLLKYALKLGSDCPFFILNEPSFAQGRGEILEKKNLDLSAYKFLIVNPDIHINTREAFSKIQPKIPSKKIAEIILQPVETWKEELVNDFEETVFEIYPHIKNVKQQLYGNGSVYASMSGSGSTCFGIFHSAKNIPSDIFPQNYFVKEVSGKG
jgi:4-diphosphocytidyl-2-C-methyl-D-erythritol kinase